MKKSRDLGVFRHIGPRLALLALVLSQLGPSAPCFAALAKDDSLSGGFTARPLDGALIKAVEKYVNPSANEITLGIGLYPFNPYYLGFEGQLGYTYYIDESLAWQVVNGIYDFPAAKDLTLELAQQGLTPQSISRVQYIISTDIEYIFAYGKALLFKNSIRYFRASVFGGVGAVGTTAAGADGSASSTQIALDMGLKMEFHVASSFSWVFQFRNAASLGSSGSVYPQFLLGVGLGL